MLLLGIRFATELAGVAAVALLGASAPLPAPWPLVLAVAAPLALAGLWSRVAAPRARVLSPRARQLVGTAILVLVGTALAVGGQPGWGTVLAVVAIADQLLILALGPGDPLAFPVAPEVAP